MSIHKSFKHGIGRLTAAAEGGLSTRLTQVSHKAPVRFLPVWKSSVEQAGAAICALSNYGGGMLQGDSVELHVHVKSNARLGVMTQGASRIYTQRVPNVCQATLNARVDPQALLVWAPDPCALFRSSSFQQTQHFNIDRTSSVVLIDWFSSGRYRNGERWSFDQLSSRTCLKFAGEDVPFLQDAIHMDLQAYKQPQKQQKQQQLPDDPLGVSHFQAFASLILYGDQVQSVKEQCEVLSDLLMLQHTRIRKRSSHDEGKDNNVFSDLDSLGLAGRVCMGMSRVDLGDDHGRDAHVVRLAATTNEDLYRIFHHCLYPLHPQFGMEFYKERIRAKASEVPRADHRVAGSPVGIEKQATILSVHEPAIKMGVKIVEEAREMPADFEDTAVMWSAFMLADSSLPTGSFAHSAGLEVAAQMGMITNTAQLETFIAAATRSTIQVTAPFLVAGHELASRMDDTRHTTEEEASVFLENWRRLDRQAQAVLASNAPACASSLDQGKSLARVAHQWLATGGEENEMNQLLLKCFDNGGCHVGPVLGALASRLGLTADQVGRLFGYCVARDMVSAAVRLSLVGPLASVKSLRKVQMASDDGWKTYLTHSRQVQARAEDDEATTANGAMMRVVDPMVIAAACAPIIEAIHPCHESLQVRLFRT